ncbi:MAG: hypothetical protein ACRD0J_01560, partial [Acidimicrobiales bacterium]
PASPGLGLFVSDPLTMAVASPAPVGERVAIDPTFSLRELVQAVDRAPRYRVLVLAGARSRIFEGLGPTLWPAAAPSPQPDPAPGARRRQRGHRFGVEMSALREVSRRRLMTSLDEALAGMAQKDPLPLVVVGSTREAALFQELSTQGPSVIGTVCGLHGRTNPARLLRLVQPVVNTYLREERDRALARLQEASEPRRAGGIDAAWTLAHDGWVELLCVEEGFAYPARVEGSCLVAAVDPEHPEVLDDAVDETMAAVADRGGTTVVVADGALSAQGRIAALLRPGAPPVEILRDERLAAAAPGAQEPGVRS